VKLAKTLGGKLIGLPKTIGGKLIGLPKTLGGKLIGLSGRDGMGRGVGWVTTSKIKVPQRDM
jgi:hypothetical protein